MELFGSVNGDEIDATEADVYLSVQLPDGTLYYWYDFGLNFIGEPNEIVSLVSSWSVQTMPEMKLFAFNVPRFLSVGTYKWYLTLVKTGSDVTQPVNWIANIGVTFVLVATKTTFPSSDSPYDYAEDSELDYESEETLGIISGDTIVADGKSSSAKPKIPSASLPTSIPSLTPERILSGGSGGSIVTKPISSRPSVGEIASIDSDEGAGYESAYDLSEPSADYAKIDSSIIDMPPPYPDDKQFIPMAGTLTAGDIDDNLNFDAFQSYANLQTANDRSLPLVDMKDRVTIRIVDSAGKGISNARVSVGSIQDSRPQINTYAGTDGQFYLFPNFDGIKGSQMSLQLAPPQDEFGSASTVFSRSQPPVGNAFLDALRRTSVNIVYQADLSKTLAKRRLPT